MTPRLLSTKPKDRAHLFEFYFIKQISFKYIYGTNSFFNIYSSVYLLNYWSFDLSKAQNSKITPAVQYFSTLCSFISSASFTKFKYLGSRSLRLFKMCKTSSSQIFMRFGKTVFCSSVHCSIS